MNQNNANNNQQNNQNNGEYNNNSNHNNENRYNGNPNGGPQYNSNVRDFPPRQQYPRKKSAATIVIAIILILMGTSHIVDTFIPWVFNWVDSGLVISCLAIFIGFYLLVKKP